MFTYSLLPKSVPQSSARPWGALRACHNMAVSPCRFWHQRDRLIKAGLLQQQHVVVPCAAQLRVAAASMPDLWQSRSTVGTVEGVDLSCCNEQLGEQAPF